MGRFEKAIDANLKELVGPAAIRAAGAPLTLAADTGLFKKMVCAVFRQDPKGAYLASEMTQKIHDNIDDEVQASSIQDALDILCTNGCVKQNPDGRYQRD